MKFWYGSKWGLRALLLSPLALLFWGLSSLRRFLFRSGIITSQRLDAPVIVVGNIAIGGTGKTPMVVWLVEQLRAAGWQPGIISRGYGGNADSWPQAVDADSDTHQVGDEPVLLAQRCQCPIAVAPKRVEAGQLLLQRGDVDVLIADDGLQHYHLQRDAELVVMDAQRGFGNGWLLPAGPLRELPGRLATVDLCVVNGAEAEGALADQGLGLHNATMQLAGDELVSLDGQRRMALADIAEQTAQQKVRPTAALAGIGNPERFFAQLRTAGLSPSTHHFADHHHFQFEDIDLPFEVIIMTEKDAVKCRPFADHRHWYLPVSAQLPKHAFSPILKKLQAWTHSR